MASSPRGLLSGALLSSRPSSKGELACVRKNWIMAVVPHSRDGKNKDAASIQTPFFTDTVL